MRILRPSASLSGSLLTLVRELSRETLREQHHRELVEKAIDVEFKVLEEPVRIHWPKERGEP